MVSPSEESLVEFGILGPLEAVRDERTLSLPRGRGRALLALLILRVDQVVSSDRLIDELWGERPPPTAATALQGLVSNLRKRLEPAQTPTVVLTREPGYVLAVDPERIDAHRFRRLVKEAATASPAERADRLRAALSLWRGPALADFTYQPFAQTAITALEELRVSALEDRIDADLELGRHGQVLAELQVLVADHPLRERLHGQLMVAFYRLGRQAQALDVYRRLQRRLVEELGIDPGPSLQWMEAAILRQDSSLDPPVEETQRDTAGRSWLPSGRKTITVVFVDVGPVNPAPGLDPETRQWLIGQGYESATATLSRHGGTVQGMIGEVVVAVFGVPVAHEDDAARGVRAAAELQMDLAGLNDRLEAALGTRLAARIGVDTGEVVVGRPGDGGPSAAGDAVNVAARLQQAAGPDEVLIGEATRRLVGEAALVEPVESPIAEMSTWRLTGLASSAPPVFGGDETTMVGRDAELTSLRAAFDTAVRQQQAGLVLVLGEAGIGKTRLIREFGSLIESEALVVTGNCLAYGEGITFWPLQEVVRGALLHRGAGSIFELFPVEERYEAVAGQIAGAIGLTDPSGRPQDLFAAVGTLFEILARPRPLVVAIDDVHWALPTLLDLIDYLAVSVQQPVLLVCLARPEFQDQHRTWTGQVTSLSLKPLDPDDSEKLMADRLVGRAMPSATLTRVLDMAQGNPLFIEQIVAALREDGEVSIPPSVEALLATRIDRLGPAERDLLRCASIIGMDFTAEALSELVPTVARPFVARHLKTLREKELIRPKGTAFLGRPAHRFRHSLIQHAAYRSITRQVRSDLHERFADWLKGVSKDGSLEFDEMLGYHLEQAYQCRRELGMTDSRTVALALGGGEWLASAGFRAAGRFDVSATENLLSRARALLPSNHSQHPRIGRHLAEVYQVLGRHSEADALLAEMLQEADLAADTQRIARISIERARISLFTGPDPSSLSTIAEAAGQALEMFEETGDHAGAAQATYVLGLVDLRRGDPVSMEEVSRRGLAHARRSESSRDEAAMMWWVALAVVEGPTPVEEGIDAVRELSDWQGESHPGVLCELGRLWAMKGELEKARRLITQGRRLFVERVRGRRPLMFVAQRSAEVELMGGDPSVAERELRAGLEMAEEMRERMVVSQLAALLALSLLRRGSSEADRCVRLSVEAAPGEEVTAQVLSGIAQATEMARAGDGEGAERVARQAVDLVPVDMLNLAARARLGLADVLQAVGHLEAARTVAEEAAQLFEKKGNLAGVAQSRTIVR